ncbi:MAG: hypothetical protein H0W90_08000 [Actinobacteria bacterium]|nr:hypothetical protein [Actinomycetota bacterium]
MSNVLTLLTPAAKLKSALDDLRDADLDAEERFNLLSFVHAIHAEIEEAAKRHAARLIAKRA